MGQCANERLLIVAHSARALAASAVRAGCRPDVIDTFADADTRALADECHVVATDNQGLNPHALLECLADYQMRHGNVSVLPGTGFEAQPWLLERLAGYGPVFANSAGTVRRVKQPAEFAATLARLGLSTPRISLTAVNNSPDTWLCKPCGGTGGVGIHDWQPGKAPPPDCYLQVQTPGQPASIVFLADGERHRIIGYNLCAPAGRGDWRFASAVKYQPATALAQRLESAVAVLVPEFGLRGLCGLDVLIDDDGFQVLEINPRPPASFELHESGTGLVAAHIAACRGTIPGNVQLRAGFPGKRVVYAGRPCMIHQEFKWPDWCADRPYLPAVIPAGAPICTVFAGAASPAQTLAALAQREQELQAAFQTRQNVFSDDQTTTTKEAMA